MSDSVRPHRRQPARPPCPWDSLGKNTGVGGHFLLQCMKVKSESEVAQSCPTLGNPMDCSPPGSSVHGIFQARVLEWGAIAIYIYHLPTYRLLTRLSSLSTCPSICLPIGPSIIWVYLPIICLCTCLSICPSTICIHHLYLPCAYHVYLPTYLSIISINYLPIYHLYLPICLPIYHLRKWQSTPALLPGKSHGRRSLIGYSPRGSRVRHD